MMTTVTESRAEAKRPAGDRAEKELRALEPPWAARPRVEAVVRARCLATAPIHPSLGTATRFSSREGAPTPGSPLSAGSPPWPWHRTQAEPSDPGLCLARDGHGAHDNH